MRTLVVILVFVVATITLSLSGRESPAAVQDKAASVKWEYALLMGGPNAVMMGGAAPVGKDVAGIVGKDVAGFMAKGGFPGIRYGWASAQEDIDAGSWSELAEKLKVDLKDKKPNSLAGRVAILNHLGAQGWELVSESEPGLRQTSTFKRRLP